MTYDVRFTSTVGVAPGTTTMQLGGLRDGASTCPPDEPGAYIFDPIGTDAFAAGAAAELLARDDSQPVWDPYADPVRLNGLGNLRDATTDEPLTTGTSPRWGLVLASAVIVFGVTLGIAHFARR